MKLSENTLFIIIAGYMLIMSLILFIMMGIDKARAKAGCRRIREWTLFILAALGGALGGVLGMSVFHHKTLHTSFRLGMPALMTLNFAAAFALMWFNGR